VLCSGWGGGINHTQTKTKQHAQQCCRAQQKIETKSAEMTDLCELEANDCDQGSSGQRLSLTHRRRRRAARQQQRRPRSDNQLWTATTTTKNPITAPRPTQTQRHKGRRQQQRPDLIDDVCHTHHTRCRGLRRSKGETNKPTRRMVKGVTVWPLNGSHGGLTARRPHRVSA